MTPAPSARVTLEVGGRRYTLSCTPGEEEHVTRLGAMVAEKVAALGPPAGQSEAGVLLYAALLLADELDEARRHEGAAASAALEALADRLEQLAARLESAGQSA